MEFRVRALAQDRAGVEDLITRLEQRHLGADRVDHTGRVKSQNLEFAFGRSGALAHLVVDRIGRDRLHGDTDVAALRLRLCGLEIDQRVLILDRKRLLVADGLHALLSIRRDRPAVLTGGIAPVLQVNRQSVNKPGGVRQRWGRRRNACRRQNANCVRIAIASNFEPTSAVETDEACLDTLPWR